MATPAGEPRTVPAVPPIDRVVRVPGSKSLTNRALVLAAMAAGTTDLECALRSDDTDALAGALAALGASVTPREGCTDPGAVRDEGFVVCGAGGAFPAGDEVRVDLGHGGTPTRFMMAAAAFARRRVTIDGSARMRERPVADGVELLRALGVRADWAGESGWLPLAIDGRGGPPAGGTIEVGALASSQFVSALLLVAPWMREGLVVRFREAPVSRSYVSLTIDELRRWGAAVEETEDAHGQLQAVRVAPLPLACRGTCRVEPDASSALYWGAAAAIVPGSDVVLHGLPPTSRQPDVRAIDALGAMGAEIIRGAGDLRLRCRRAAGDRAPPLDGIDADLGMCPDGALMLVAAAAVASGPSRFEGLGTLRVKESDRLSAMAEGLRRVGARPTVGADWIAVEPMTPGHRVDAVIDPHADHRIAMSFAILGLRTGGIRIADPNCVAKSYPSFWRCVGILGTAGSAASHPGLA